MTDTKALADLLPCPFCGGEAALLCGGAGNWFVQCPTCKASSNDVGRDRAIELWNRRATLSQERGGQVTTNMVEDVLNAEVMGPNGSRSLRYYARVGMDHMGHDTDRLENEFRAALQAALSTPRLQCTDEQLREVLAECCKANAQRYPIVEYAFIAAMRRVSLSSPRAETGLDPVTVGIEARITAMRVGFDDAAAIVRKWRRSSLKSEQEQLAVSIEQARDRVTAALRALSTPPQTNTNGTGCMYCDVGAKPIVNTMLDKQYRPFLHRNHEGDLVPCTRAEGT